MYLKFFNEVNEYKLIYNEGNENFVNKEVNIMPNELELVNVEEIKKRREHFMKERKSVMEYLRNKEEEEEEGKEEKKKNE